MPVVSPSQAKKFHDQCKRQWAWRYLEHKPDKQGPGAALGELCHARVESYLTGRVVECSDETWELAKATPEKIESILEPFFASDKCPDPATAHSEMMCKLSTGTNIPLVGKIDWWYYFEGGPGGVPAKCIAIEDLKTCKNYSFMPDMFMLTDDHQARAYAAAALDLSSDWTWCRFRWHYVKTAKDRALGAYPEPRIIEFWESRAGCEKMKREILRSVAPLIKLYHEPQPPMSLPPNWDACGMYGGCAYADLCSGDKEVNQPNNDTMPDTSQHEALQKKIMELQRQLLGVKTEPAPAPELAPPPEPVPAPPPEPVPASEPKKRGRPKGSKNKPKTDEAAPVVETPVVETPVVETPVVETPVVETETSPSAPTGVKRLYVNCSCTPTPPVWIEQTEAFRLAEQMATAASKKPHWSLADYGQGPAMLAQAFRRHLDQLPASVRVSNSAASTRALLDVLIEWADEIITGGA